MKVLSIAVLLLSFSTQVYANTQMCQAIKNDNHALVKALMTRGSESFEEKYKKLHCFNKTLLEHAEKSPKTRAYFIKTMPYELIAREHVKRKN